MHCFDADVLVYAAEPGHPLGARVRPLFAQLPPGEQAGLGSLLLLVELIAKPRRQGRDDEELALLALLARLDLRPLDPATAELAVALSARYALQAADAVHLATGVRCGATRFITNNSRHFRRDIVEIEITYPLDLPEVPQDSAR